MSDPELSNKAVRIARCPEPRRNARECIGDRCRFAIGHARQAREDDRSCVRRIFIVKTSLVLLIEVDPVCEADTPPASREYPDACEAVDHIPIKCVRGMAADMNPPAMLRYWTLEC